ncbi:MAG: sensor histidine kinase, partial [Spirochaetes bacterium]
LKQILYNLLSNAVKFSESGKRIGLRAYPQDGCAIIEVWDEGRGIDTKDV